MPRSGGSAVGNSVLTRRRQEMYWFTSALRVYASGLPPRDSLDQCPSDLDQDALQQVLGQVGVSREQVRGPHQRLLAGEHELAEAVITIQCDLLARSQRDPPDERLQAFLFFPFSAKLPPQVVTQALPTAGSVPLLGLGEVGTGWCVCALSARPPRVSPEREAPFLHSE